MTTHLTISNGQQSYVWSGQTQLTFNGAEWQELARYDCVYCGSGDFVLSAKPSPVVVVEGVEYGCGYVLPGTQGNGEQVGVVPEPGTAVMLGVAITLWMVWRWAWKRNTQR
jgi:hypothetical protein